MITLLWTHFEEFWGFPSGSEDKESAFNAGNVGSIPALRRSSGEGNGNPLQYSCLENPMDRGAWRATVHVCLLSCFGRVQLLGNLWTVVY